MKANEKNRMQKTADDIIEYIIEHNMKPGDKLPTEPELSELVQAGRSTVREAMRTLATRNIVEIRQGSGTYISGKKGMIEDPFGLFFIDDKQKLMRDLMDLRLQIEPDMAAQCASNATFEDLIQMKDVLDHLRNCMQNNTDYTEADYRFHECIADGSKNLITARLIPLFKTAGRYIKEEDPSILEDLVMNYQELYDAIEKKDSISARDIMYLHLIKQRRLLYK